MTDLLDDSAPRQIVLSVDRDDGCWLLQLARIVVFVTSRAKHKEHWKHLQLRLITRLHTDCHGERLTVSYSSPPSDWLKQLITRACEEQWVDVVHDFEPRPGGSQVFVEGPTDDHVH